MIPIHILVPARKCVCTDHITEITNKPEIPKHQRIYS